MCSSRATVLAPVPAVRVPVLAALVPVVRVSVLAVLAPVVRVSVLVPVGRAAAPVPAPALA